MSVLYIGTNSVCLINKSFSKILYQSSADKIDYKKLIELLKKDRKPIVIINSFYVFIEHKTFSLGLGKKEIEKSVNNRLSQNDVVCASYNHLFAKGKGAEHKDDLILTIIKYSEEEKHIKKILQELLKIDLDLSHIYSFDQMINTIGMSYSVLNHNINVNVVLLDNSAMIMVSNTTHFMFGRLIKKRENEDLLITMSKMLATTLKYISTTYSFLHNELKITIMSQTRADIDIIKSIDPVFDGVRMMTQILSMPQIKIAAEIPNIVSEIKLLKLSLPNLKKVNVITNRELFQHVKAHNFIKILRFIAIFLLIGTSIYGVFRWVSGTKLSINDKQIDRQYDAVVQKTQFEEKKLAVYDEKVYAIIASEMKKNITDNSHLETLKSISKVFQKHRQLTFVEGYRFNCNNCLLKNRVNILYVDFILFNVNLSARFAVNKLNAIEKDLTEMLSKKYNNVEIKFQQLSKDKKIASVRDVKDTMIITFSND